jgi:hypothetical protein
MLDLVVCVYACDTLDKYKKQILKINETYENLLNEFTNIKILFFLGEEKTDLIGEQYINLPNVKNDYSSATYKQFYGLKHIYENYDTKFVMLMGTDTYFNIKKLDLFLKNYDSNENLFIGGHGDYRKIGEETIYFHSGGAGFIITKKALELIYPKLETFPDEWIKMCNERHAHFLCDACDCAISYLLQKFNTQIIDIPGLVFTHCNYQGHPCHLNQIIHSDLVSCHNMSLEDFDSFTLILKNNNYFV